MPEQQQIQVQIDPNGYYITGLNLGFTEEEFAFLISSQNQARQFLCSPKHAKRIMLVLQKFIDEYEKKFGILNTELPKNPNEASEKKKFGF